MGTRNRWTDGETAIVLNHLDWCFINEQNYWLTVEDVLKPETKRTLSLRKIEDVLYKCCRLQKQKKKINPHDLVNNGTRILENYTISKSLRQAMNKGRRGLGLGAFEKRKEFVFAASPGTSKRDLRVAKMAQEERVISPPNEDHQDTVVSRTSRTRAPRSVSPQVLIPSCSRNERKGKRGRSLSSSVDTSDNDIISIRSTTVSNLTAPSQSPAGVNKSSLVEARLTALEEEQRTTARALHMSVGCLTWVFRQQVGPKYQVPDEIFTTMQNIARTIEFAPADAFERLVRDLQQANVVREEYQTLARDLIGRRDYTTKEAFPPEPAKSEIAKAWQDIRSPLKDAMSDNTASVSTARLAVAGTMSTTHLTTLANGNLDSMIEPHCWISSRQQHFKSPFTVRHLIAIVLCQLLFCGTETMCEITPWVEQIYKTVADREEVRRMDRAAAHLFFQESYFKEEVLPNRISEIRDCLKACARIINDATGPNPALQCTSLMSTRAIKRALHLKRTLMLSLYEYHIYSASFDMDFDPVWMEAEDNEGRSLSPLSCTDKKVCICMFPALIRAGIEELPPDAEIAAALIQAKSFFPPGWKTSPCVDEDFVVAKAVVLLHE